MTRVCSSLLVALLLAAPALAQAVVTPTGVPAGYVNASTLLPLPEFIPGAGALYIDPANAPVGPWLAYGKDGAPVELLYMVPVSAMQAAQNWDELASDLLGTLGVGIDHVDITYNGGHPGLAEPHYHVRLVFVGHEAQQAALTP